MASEISEAAQIALESSELLVAPEALVEQIEKDLLAIRAKYPIIAHVRHQRKWKAGELLVYNVTQEKLDEINESAYGPTHSAKSLLEDEIFLVIFNRPYNAEKLAEKLKDEFEISETSPNVLVGATQGIFWARHPYGQNVYVIWSGCSDCPPGCIHNHFWTFETDDNNSVELVEQRGNDLKEEESSFNGGEEKLRRVKKGVFPKLRKFFKRNK